MRLLQWMYFFHTLCSNPVLSSYTHKFNIKSKNNSSGTESISSVFLQILKKQLLLKAWSFLLWKNWVRYSITLFFTTRLYIIIFERINARLLSNWVFWDMTPMKSISNYFSSRKYTYHITRARFWIGGSTKEIQDFGRIYALFSKKTLFAG